MSDLEPIIDGIGGRKPRDEINKCFEKVNTLVDNNSPSDVTFEELNGKVNGLVDVVNNPTLDKQIINLNDLYSVPDADLVIYPILPNPYPEEVNQPVHPSILYFRNKWNGYSYWIAFTPYPDADSSFENPCVVASNDMVDFVSPTSNPLVESPSGSAYNSDTHIVMSPDGLTMYLLFRERGIAKKNNLKIMSTTDGVSWTDPITVLSGTTGVQDFATPSAYWNGSAWVLITHNLDSGATGWDVERRVSETSDIMGSYGTAELINIPYPDGVTGWWHSFFMQNESGQVLGVIQNASGVGGSGNIYLCQSFDDSVNFTKPKVLWPEGGRYRSTFCIRDNDIQMLMSDFNGTMYFYKIESGRLYDISTEDDRYRSILANPENLPFMAELSDNFDRANGAIGDAASGQTWITTGSGYDIVDGKAKALSNGAKASIEVDSDDYKYTVVMSGMTDGIQQWVTFRGEGRDFIRVGTYSGNSSGSASLALQSIIGGLVGETVLLGNFYVGDILSFLCISNSTKIYLNHEFIYEYVGVKITGKNIGMQSNLGTTSLFSGISVDALV